MADVERKKRWMPLALGLSLAANLAVVAALAGAAWRHNGEERGGPPRAAKGGAIYMKALPPEARRAVHEELRGGPHKDLDATDMVLALRSDPFDPAAAQRVLDAQRDAGLQRQSEVSAAWLAQITAMNTRERSAYADRVEEMSQERRARGIERRGGDS